jgi:hypothetical protein
MRALTVDARSRESGEALYSALAGFHPELSGDDEEGWRVVVQLASDKVVLEILRLLEEHVSERADGPARIGLDGRTYTLHTDGST